MVKKKKKINQVCGPISVRMLPVQSARQLTRCRNKATECYFVYYCMIKIYMINTQYEQQLQIVQIDHQCLKHFDKPVRAFACMLMGNTKWRQEQVCGLTGYFSGVCVCVYTSTSWC